MSATQHAYPLFERGMDINKNVVLGTDSIKAGLIQSGTAYTWNATSQGNQFVHDIIATGSGSALTECTDAAYARQTLAGVTFVASGATLTLSCSPLTVTFPAATTGYSVTYAFFYDGSVGAGDTTYPLICYWDFGGTVTTQAGGQVTLNVNASGLVQWTF